MMIDPPPDFPNLVVFPTTAHRLPNSSQWRSLVEGLRSFDVNAAAFLMDEKLLEADGFKNDPDRARHDLLAQLPTDAREFINPPPPPFDAAASIPDASASSSSQADLLRKEARRMVADLEELHDRSEADFLRADARRIIAEARNILKGESKSLTVRTERRHDQQRRRGPSIGM